MEWEVHKQVLKEAHEFLRPQEDGTPAVQWSMLSLVDVSTTMGTGLRTRPAEVELG